MELNKEIRDILIEFAMIVQEEKNTNSQILIRSTYDTFRIQNIVEKLTIPIVVESLKQVKKLNIANVSNRLDEKCCHCKENLYTELVPICKTENCRYNDY